MSKGNVLLCAGGTGGHLFPAQAVAHEMNARGYSVHLAADDRALNYSDSFPAQQIHPIRSATLTSKNLVIVVKSLVELYSGYRQSRKLISEIKPVVAAGFGGYPTVPPIFAAMRMGIPTLVHEANAVLGRANRLLGKYVDRVAIGFGETNRIGGIEVTVTGNPVRPEIIVAAEEPYPERTPAAAFCLLVFGGSQGATFFSQCLPEACRLLDGDSRRILEIVQQARLEDRDSLIEAYQTLGISARVETFFTDMAGLLSDAHLVCSRAGASTVSELAVMGRPAILVPYPHALDHDQAANAEAVSRSGGALIFNQSDLSAAKLAAELTSAIQNPKKLSVTAGNAKSVGQPKAASTLADMLEALAS